MTATTRQEIGIEGPSKWSSAKDMVMLGAIQRLTRGIARGRIVFELSDGRTVVCDSGNLGPNATIRLHDRKAIRRIAENGYLGLAEGYLEQDWSTPSLAAVFDFGAANMDQLDRDLISTWVGRMVNSTRHFLNRNTKRGSRRNIAQHYDLGNEFFSKWLDPSMTYSAADFLDADNIPLYTAQENKYRRIVDRLGVKTGDHILEIGCGWGGFAEFAATQAGANVTAVTISKEQHDFAQSRMERSGLAGQVSVELKDYRDIVGTYDHVVSIEMLEAVGEAFWLDYFETLSRCLRAGAGAVVQVITVPDSKFDYYRRNVDFIQKYIFPGGMLPCPGAMSDVANTAGLTLEDVYMFGSDYARTLDLWRDSFEAKWPVIKAMGFDDYFKRMWEYYLHYTAAGFRSEATDVGQFLFRKL
jgi:cyclopropane-fatty-acyl-phospholipid synthase